MNCYRMFRTFVGAPIFFHRHRSPLVILTFYSITHKMVLLSGAPCQYVCRTVRAGRQKTNGVTVVVFNVFLRKINFVFFFSFAAAAAAREMARHANLTQRNPLQILDRAYGAPHIGVKMRENGGENEC